MKRRQVAFLLVLNLFVFAGCATVQPSGYLDNYDSLEPKSGLKKTQSVPGLSLEEKKTVFVEKPRIAATGLKLGEVAAEGYAQQFSSKLSSSLRTSGLFLSVATHTDGSEYSGEDYVFESYIARLDGGNGFLRWFFGMGAGMSDVQIEGKLIDKSDASASVVFADRRRETGNPFLGLNVTAFSNERQIRRSIDHIVEAIGEYLMEFGG